MANGDSNGYFKSNIFKQQLTSFSTLFVILGGSGIYLGGEQIGKFEQRQLATNTLIATKIDAMVESVSRMEKEFSVAISNQLGDSRVVLEKIAANERRIEERFTELQRQVNTLRGKTHERWIPGY